MDTKLLLIGGLALGAVYLFGSKTVSAVGGNLNPSSAGSTNAAAGSSGTNRILVGTSSPSSLTSSEHTNLLSANQYTQQVIKNQAGYITSDSTNYQGYKVQSEAAIIANLQKEYGANVPIARTQNPLEYAYTTGAGTYIATRSPQNVAEVKSNRLANLTQMYNSGAVKKGTEAYDVLVATGVVSDSSVNLDADTISQYRKQYLGG